MSRPAHGAVNGLPAGLAASIETPASIFWLRPPSRKDVVAMYGYDSSTVTPAPFLVIQSALKMPPGGALLLVQNMPDGKYSVAHSQPTVLMYQFAGFRRLVELDGGIVALSGDAAMLLGCGSP